MDGKTENLTWNLGEDGLGILTLNRPEQRNALTKSMVEDLHHALRTMKAEQARGLIFQGAGGKAFVSGADIGELRDRTQHDALRQINSGLFAAVEEFPAPTFAAINGFALGGGLEFALACNFRLCGASARLGQPEVSLGILPAAGGCTRLTRVIGLGRATDLILTARILEAGEALSFGLVHRVVPDTEVEAATRSLAKEVLAHSPLALQHAKRMLSATSHGEASYLRQLESSLQAELFADPEKLRRMDEFLAKRKSSKGTPQGNSK